MLWLKLCRNATWKNAIRHAERCATGDAASFMPADASNDRRPALRAERPNGRRRSFGEARRGTRRPPPEGTKNTRSHSS